jgi:hypothetical protein
VRLRNPGAVDRAVTVLRPLRDRLDNYRGNSDPEYFLAWCTEASRTFREQFSSQGLADLADQDRTKITFGGGSVLRMREYLDHSMQIWQARVDAAISQLAALKPFIERPGQVVVVDTSAFIEGEYFTDFDWRSLDGVERQGPLRLIVPVTVIDELDHLKQDRRAGDRARSVLHRLWDLRGADPLAPLQLKAREGVAIEVLLDDHWHVRLRDPDAEIIDRAVYVGELVGRDVLLVAGDYGMLYRAVAGKLRPVLMPRR